jgi:hypothetical protein
VTLGYTRQVWLVYFHVGFIFGLKAKIKGCYIKNLFFAFSEREERISKEKRRKGVSLVPFN